MAIRAIAFCRVSTTQQDYQRQISDLMPLIKGDGYNEDEIEVIKHKESATKNDVYNRQSIVKLKTLISENQIESLYCTECSRLARRGDVLYSVLALLEERHISLVIQTPSIIRTYENGKPNPIAHVVIAFLGQVAQQEMELKKERQKSGYAQKVKDGKVCSSKVKFGYKRDKDGYAVIDKEEAKVVLDIFQLYLSGVSVTAIWDKYTHTGILRKLPNKSGWNMISNMLRDKTYIGSNSTFQYPRLLSDDIFNKVQEKMDGNKMIKSKLKYVYYCQGLLKYDGHVMTPAVSEVVYSYRNPDTGKTTGINMNAMDSLLWSLSCVSKSIMDSAADEERHKNIQIQLDLIESKLEGIKEDKADNEKQADRAAKIYVMGKLSEDKFNALTEALNGQIEHLLNEESELLTTKAELEAVLSKSEGVMREVKDYNTISSITDDKLRQDIIRECIEYVDVELIEKGVFNIRVHYVDKSQNNDTYYRYVQKGCKKHLYCVYGDMYEDWTNGIVDRIKHYQRK